ncbi:MAG: hypothetical protein U1A78_04640 [Polyangia bacterium]
MNVITIADLQNGLQYLRSNPHFLLRAALNAARLRFGAPMDAVRWLIGRLAGRKLPQDFQIEAMPPGLRVSATAEVMGTPIFVSAVITVEDVTLATDSARVRLRVTDLAVKPPDGSPVAQMVMMMDLGKPGDLLGFLPMKPPMIVSAQGDQFVLDLLQLPKLARNARAKAIVAAVSEILAVRELLTEDDLLVVGLKAMPRNLLAALGHLRGA